MSEVHYICSRDFTYKKMEIIQIEKEKLPLPLSSFKTIYRKILPFLRKLMKTVPTNILRDKPESLKQS
jgi:hypothetical protein